VEAARGEICIFLDDDAQFIDPQATCRTIAYFQSDPRLTCVAFLIRNAFTGLEDYKAIPRTDKRSINEDYPCSYYCGAGAALKRQVIIDLGMFWEKLVYGEELDFSYRLLDNDYRLIRTVSIEVIHREVAQARPEGQWVSMNAWYRCWIAAKNLPWIYVVSTTLLWWLYTALIGLKRGQLNFFIRGMWNAVIGLPSVLRERRVIGKAALRKLKRLSGRLWY
jgi:GT2 family glycosyltransferase